MFLSGAASQAFHDNVELFVNLSKLVPQPFSVPVAADNSADIYFDLYSHGVMLLEFNTTTPAKPTPTAKATTEPTSQSSTTSSATTSGASEEQVSSNDGMRTEQNLALTFVIVLLYAVSEYLFI